MFLGSVPKSKMVLWTLDFLFTESSLTFTLTGGQNFIFKAQENSEMVFQILA